MTANLMKVTNVDYYDFSDTGSDNLNNDCRDLLTKYFNGNKIYIYHANYN